MATLRSVEAGWARYVSKKFFALAAALIWLWYFHGNVMAVVTQAAAADVSIAVVWCVAIVCGTYNIAQGIRDTWGPQASPPPPVPPADPPVVP